MIQDSDLRCQPSEAPAKDCAPLPATRRRCADGPQIALMQLICTPVRSRSMTRLGCQTQARPVFRQGNGIKPHFQHTLQFAVAQACVIKYKISLLDVDTS